LNARNADKFALYQKSVQMPEAARFLDQRFRLITGRPLRFLREDFCGTAFNCCEFVKINPNNRAIGVDLDETSLRWCLEHNYPGLRESEWKRITLIHGNVLTVETPRVDMIVVLNHSYAILSKRSDLLNYFRRARASLRKDGVFVLDHFGGPQLFEGFRFETRFDQFTFFSEWTQLNPISHELVIHLSYAFEDGSFLQNAFNYHFRIWSLPELQDLFVESGFHNVHVLWGFEKANSEFLAFRKTPRGASKDLYYALVVGQA
jgi:SAM-dependent methyltransferase